MTASTNGTSAPTIRVSIGEVRKVADYADGRPRYRLDWTLLIPEGIKEGKTLTHTDRDVVDIFRSELLKADGATFDRKTGLPKGVHRPTAVHGVSDAAGKPIYCDIAQRLHDRWAQKNRRGQRKGHTVRSLLNEGISVSMALLSADAPALDLAQRTAARDWMRRQLIPAHVQQRAADADAAKLAAARAGGPKNKQQTYRWRRADERAADRAKLQAETDAQWAAFFDRYALRWYDLDAPAMRRALAALRLRVDGEPNEPQTSTKHFVALNELMTWGVDHGKLVANPLKALEKWERPSTTTKIKRVDRRQVPGMDYLVQLIDVCRQLGVDGDLTALRVVVLIAVLALAGLRPSEARALHVEDFTLPPRGWGTLTFGTRTTTPGRLFTDDGEPDEHGSLKWRDTDELRDVPIPPMLVAIVRRHIRDFDLRDEDYLVCDEDGNQLDTTAITDVWHRVREAVFADPGAKKVLTLKLKDLRHTRASLLLAARAIPDAIIAAWLGHDTAVLRTTYESFVKDTTNPYSDQIARYRNQLVPPEYDGAAPPAGASEDALRMLRQAIESGADQRLLLALVSTLAPPADQEHSDMSTAGQQPGLRLVAGADGGAA